MSVYANGRDTSLRVLGQYPGAGDVGSKALSMAPAVVSGNKPCFYTENGFLVSRMQASLRGSAVPSVNWTVRFAPTRDAVGTEIIEGGETSNDLANGNSHLLFSNSAIPANSFVWLEVTAVGGTVDEFGVTIIPTLPQGFVL